MTHLGTKTVELCRMHSSLLGSHYFTKIWRSEWVVSSSWAPTVTSVNSCCYPQVWSRERCHLTLTSLSHVQWTEHEHRFKPVFDSTAMPSVGMAGGTKTGATNYFCNFYCSFPWPSTGVHNLWWLLGTWGKPLEEQKKGQQGGQKDSKWSMFKKLLYSRRQGMTGTHAS